jgi:selenocysteine-specific elongation factor
LARGILRETLREKLFSHLPSEIFKATLAGLETARKIAAEKDFVRAAAHNLELSGDEKNLREKILGIYQAAKLEVPKLEDVLLDSIRGTKSDKNHARKIFQLLLNSGEIVKISDEFYFAREELERLVAKLRKFAENSADKLIDVSGFKDIAGISRKYAIPLLEYFDRARITRRAGDKRLIL